MKKKVYTDKVGYKLTPAQKFYRFIKSIFDFVFALFAIIILSPVFIITAIAIKIDSKGPVIFKQKRVGYKGKTFYCLKFRSMKMEANHEIAGYEYEDVNDYITKVGAFIRKYSIDELPQFFLLLTGKMSLIGFRPSQSNEIELNEAREAYDIYQTKPGISGWAQVNGRDLLASEPTLKAKYDNYYMQHMSLWLDIKIFFLTIVRIFQTANVEEGTIRKGDDEVGMTDSQEEILEKSNTTKIIQDTYEDKKDIV